MSSAKPNGSGRDPVPAEAPTPPATPEEAPLPAVEAPPLAPKDDGLFDDRFLRTDKQADAHVVAWKDRDEPKAPAPVEPTAISEPPTAIAPVAVEPEEVGLRKPISPEVADPSLRNERFSDEERADVDRTRIAWGRIVAAEDEVEDIDRWVPEVVPGIRAMRARALRITEAVDVHDFVYRKQFNALVEEELPFGLRLLTRKGDLNAIHYLGETDDRLAKFMAWRADLTAEQRDDWRTVQTNVKHYRESLIPKPPEPVPSPDRRTPEQKEVEQVRTDANTAVAVAEAETEEVREELAAGVVKTPTTLWATMKKAGANKLATVIRENASKEFIKTLIKELTK